MEKTKFRRRTYIVDKKLQFRFIGNIYIIMLILFIALGALLIFSSSHEVAGSIYTKLNKIKNTNEIFLNLVVKFSFLILLIGFILISVKFVLFSHRIVGPIYRFKQSLMKLGGGDLTLKMNFREKDELKDLAELFTGTIAQLNKKMKAVKKESKSIESLARKKSLSGTDMKKFKENSGLMKKAMEGFKV
ncbi:MAG: methyl-accepting chemotaxis protein [bacterium]|nr:methyl-accepting chemotaxis protein [bacterium]